MSNALPERFWNKIQPNGDCWIWSASTDQKGYGTYFLGRVDGRSVFGKAHRLAYEDLVGPIPEGKQLDHLCRVKNCVNPDHLEPVSPKENIRRGNIGEINRARILARTACKNGHDWDTYGRTVTRKNGRVHRQCRQCEKEANARYRSKVRSESA